MGSNLSYDAVGSTCVLEARWALVPQGYRRFERTTYLGHGERFWQQTSTDLLSWAVKTRSGFRVVTGRGEELRVKQGQDRVLVASLGPFALREPVRVVSVVDDPDRCGFAYGTRAGHPVSGEEAFIVHRTTDGDVWLTLRSLTRPAGGLWRLVYPAALVAQRFYRLRYSRALRETT
jgi:uncharacterized protein (UPF0548 family)